MTLLFKQMSGTSPTIAELTLTIKEIIMIHRTQIAKLTHKVWQLEEQVQKLVASQQASDVIH